MSSSTLSHSSVYFTVAKIVKAPQFIQDFYLDPVKVFEPDHSSPKAILDFLSHHMSTLVNSCPVHSIIEPSAKVSHTLVSQCTTPLANTSGHYHQQYACNLVPPPDSCYKCLTPYGRDLHFDHPIGKCKRPEGYVDLWRAIPYLCWRVKELRDTVFGYLGVPQNVLAEGLGFVKWLRQPLVKLNDQANTGYRDSRIVNWTAAIYAYFHLRFTTKSISFQPKASR
ncbi:hypothetical protein AAF712_008579 [Marasmius tenuissimus]|uniref:Uncharacterized protein n=1 Tax=Marasmius tenuissimus TaxID=585030 RepID=A0ABR2ZS70_9AGAR